MMAVNVLLLSGIFVILSSLAIIDAPILLTNDITKSFNRSSFPQGFIFGTASSAYQYEGAENVGGKGPSIWDNYSTHKYQGAFDTAHAAACAYDRSAIKLRGVEADINFNIEDYEEDLKQVSHWVPDVFQVMLQISHRVFHAETTWRLVGLMSCYALSPSFNRLIGKWTVLKFFLVLMIISVHPFFYDGAANGKPEILSIISNAAFALVSLSWHKLISFAFGIGVFSYFLGPTINWMLIFVAIIFRNVDFGSKVNESFAGDSKCLSLSIANALWRLVGLVSSVVGLLCYALSPSFNRLIGRWNILKFSLYAVFSLAIFTTILFVKQFSPSTRYAHIKTYTSFVVLMIISVYSFYYDKALNGKPEILSIVSNAAFALMSLSLSKLIKFGFEIGIFAYFLGCLVVQLWTINWMLISVAVIFGCPLFVMHSSSDSQQEVDTDQIIDESSGSDPEVGNAGQQDVGNESQVIIDSYPDSQEEVSCEGQVTHRSSDSITEVASSGDDQHLDIILDANSISVVAL